MNIKYENETWVIEDEYFITREVHEYTVYNCGTETEEAKEQFSSESFEECLSWIYNKGMLTEINMIRAELESRQDRIGVSGCAIKFIEKDWNDLCEDGVNLFKSLKRPTY